jgi:hypothetical protein
VEELEVVIKVVLVQMVVLKDLLRKVTMDGEEEEVEEVVVMVAFQRVLAKISRTLKGEREEMVLRDSL